MDGSKSDALQENDMAYHYVHHCILWKNSSSASPQPKEHSIAQYNSSKIEQDILRKETQLALSRFFPGCVAASWAPNFPTCRRLSLRRYWSPVSAQKAWGPGAGAGTRWIPIHSPPSYLGLQIQPSTGNAWHCPRSRPNWKHEIFVGEAVMIWTYDSIEIARGKIGLAYLC